MSELTPFQNAVLNAFADKLNESGGGVPGAFLFVGEFIDNDGVSSILYAGNGSTAMKVGLGRYLSEYVETEARIQIGESLGLEYDDLDAEDD